MIHSVYRGINISKVGEEFWYEYNGLNRVLSYKQAKEHIDLRLNYVNRKKTENMEQMRKKVPYVKGLPIMLFEDGVAYAYNRGRICVIEDDEFRDYPDRNPTVKHYTKLLNNCYYIPIDTFMTQFRNFYNINKQRHARNNK